MKALVVKYQTVESVAGFELKKEHTGFVDLIYKDCPFPTWMVNPVICGEAEVSRLDVGKPKAEVKKQPKQVERFTVPWYITHFANLEAPLSQEQKDELVVLVENHQVQIYNKWSGIPCVRCLNNHRFKNSLAELINKAGRFKGKADIMRAIRRIPVSIL